MSGLCEAPWGDDRHEHDGYVVLYVPQNRRATAAALRSKKREQIKLVLCESCYDALCDDAEEVGWWEDK